jgi:hypothetical protein
LIFARFSSSRRSAGVQEDQQACKKISRRARRSAGVQEDQQACKKISYGAGKAPVVNLNELSLHLSQATHHLI